ncbi:MAG: hypothetical protein O2U61_05100 [Candidatus Bathyarchaeota archaeon]|nr:hypothetical protein [Candidatus Bathyarchaeota archaeon]
MKKLRIDGFSYIVVFALAVIFAFHSVETEIKPIDTEGYLQIQVEEGQTVWQYSNQYSDRHELSFKDFKKWVAKANNIKADQIAAGSYLVIPVKENRVENAFTYK